MEEEKEREEDQWEKYENIVLKEFVLSKGKIKCKLYSYNGIINLDEEEYYLEIYSNNKNFVNYIKLTGEYDYSPKVNRKV